MFSSAADGFGDLAGVAGDHGDLDAAVLQRGDGLARFLTDSVLEADRAQDPVSRRRRAARLRRGPSSSRVEAASVSGSVIPSSFRRAGPPTWRVRPSTVARTPRPVMEVKPVAVRNVQALLPGCPDDGACHWVFAVGFDGGGQGEQLLAAGAVGSGDVFEFGFAFGQGAGLVEQDDVDGAHALQRHPVLDQHSGAGCLLGGDGDDQRDGQAQGVRAGDHQHGDGAGHGVRDAAQQRPGDEGDEAGTGGEVEQERRGPVGQGLRPGGGRLRFGDQPLDPGQRGVIPDGGDPDPDGVVRGDRSGDHRVAGGPEHGLGFTGDHGFIELGLAVDDGAVCRHPRPGPDQDHVPGAELGDADGFGARRR